MNSVLFCFLVFQSLKEKASLREQASDPLLWRQGYIKRNCLLVCIPIPEGAEEHFCLSISSTHADSKGEELMCWLGRCKSLPPACRALAACHRDHCSVIPLPCLLASRHFPLFLSVMRSSCQNKTFKSVQRCTRVAVVGTWTVALDCLPAGDRLSSGAVWGAQVLFGCTQPGTKVRCPNAGWGSLPLSVAVQCLHLNSFILETGWICPILYQYIFGVFLICFPLNIFGPAWGWWKWWDCSHPSANLPSLRLPLCLWLSC